MIDGPELATERRYSRREAPRLAKQLEEAQAELAQERALREEREAQDAAALQYVEQHYGSDQVLGALGMLKANGQISDEQDQLYATMRGLRQLVGVLYDAALQDARRQARREVFEQYQAAPRG